MTNMDHPFIYINLSELVEDQKVAKTIILKSHILKSVIDLDYSRSSLYTIFSNLIALASEYLSLYGYI